MSSISDFLGSAVPRRVTTITAVGAGTFTKLPTTRWLKVKRGGGGGGGGGNPPSGTVLARGGRRGAVCEDWLEATSPTYAYSVGAGGTAGTAGNVDGGGNGGDTTFAGLLDAPGGAGGPAGTTIDRGNGDPGESSEYGGGGRIGAVAQAGRGKCSGGGVSYLASTDGAAGAPGFITIEEY